MKVSFQTGTRSAANFDRPGSSPRARTLGRLPFLFTLLIATLSGSGAAALAQSGGVSEYEVKAAYLYNFTKFVEWPPDAFPNDKTPLVVCIFNDDSLAGALEAAVRGRTVNNRPFRVQRTKKIEELKPCHVVFIGMGESKRLVEILGSLQSSSSLVVGESPGFAERGGQIQLFLDENKLRFCINTDAVARAHLKVSSKLLVLAKIVHTGNIQSSN